MPITSTTAPFITDDFLLSNDAARRLYHDHAASQPIYDYHCHLPPEDLAANRSFGNLYDIWLAGDHYKWRAMRANGTDETLCTGDADPYDKFLAFAKTVPNTIRNPLYHWTHLELQRYFGINTLLNEDTAPEVWEAANAQLPDLNVAAILDRFKVAVIGTTDDPADTLEHHAALAESSPYDTTVIPAFRPDKSHNLTDLAAWNAVVESIGTAADTTIQSFDDFLAALKQRHAYFHQLGSRISDHGLTHLPDHALSEAEAASVFTHARNGDADAISDHDAAGFSGFMLLFFAQLDHAAGWTHQLHLGAMRNNNAWALKHLGPDTGFDSIGDFRQGPGLRRHLGTLAGHETLPQCILYNHSPVDNYLFATMIGNYQGGPPGSKSIPGKMQFGSGWWFLDQAEAMTWQINALSNNGLLTKFVGMLTDSRSFLSYPRHEYFRRLLCDILGKDVEAGLLPPDFDHLGQVVEDICFGNAKRYFGVTLRGQFADG
ncbi:MAG: glucuronate isomerase [Planctomycetota bacterium]